MLAKTKLNSIEVLIYKTLINQCISDDELVSVNNILREYDYMKKEIQKLKNSTLIIKDFNLFIKQYHYLKQKKNTHTHAESKNPKFAKKKNRRSTLSSKCAMCDSKISRFKTKKQ